ncbi:MAG: hypothetical protein NTY48_05660 [Candidatus Diapherotrites archaeon]|nr:hypothetical protein [Candidatus Diapherotrites archaeon]
MVEKLTVRQKIGLLFFKKTIPFSGKRNTALEREELKERLEDNRLVRAGQVFLKKSAEEKVKTRNLRGLVAIGRVNTIAQERKKLAEAHFYARKVSGQNKLKEKKRADKETEKVIEKWRKS